MLLCFFLSVFVFPFLLCFAAAHLFLEARVGVLAEVGRRSGGHARPAPERGPGDAPSSRARLDTGISGYILTASSVFGMRVAGTPRDHFWIWGGGALSALSGPFVTHTRFFFVPAPGFIYLSMYISEGQQISRCRIPSAAPQDCPKLSRLSANVNCLVFLCGVRGSAARFFSFCVFCVWVVRLLSYISENSCILRVAVWKILSGANFCFWVSVHGWSCALSIVSCLCFCSIAWFFAQDNVSEKFS